MLLHTTYRLCAKWNMSWMDRVTEHMAAEEMLRLYKDLSYYFYITSDTTGKKIDWPKPNYSTRVMMGRVYFSQF